MARNQIPAENVEEAVDRNPDLERSLDKAGVGADKVAPVVPTYQIISTDSKIPVSSQHGNLWKSRRDQAVNKRKHNLEEEAWDDALCYYDNSQEGARAYSDQPARKRHRGTSETENIVFANVSALVPAIYARNPQIEVTNTKAENEEPSIMHEELVNVLMRTKSMNGLNLKPKARRAVVATTLMNLSFLEVGYTFKQDSSEQALKDLEELSKSYATEKNLEKLRLIEGKIAALELKVDLLQDSGPFVKFRKPEQVLRDPDSESEDLSDDKWIMIWEYVPTTWLQATYADDKTGSKSLYKPTHVLNANSVGAEGRNSAEQEITNYTLINDDYNDRPGRTRKSQYGYDDDESYKRALRTKIWRVWDKTTRRIYMYNDKDWTWPIWVWDDPYHLDTFFPLAQLTFYTHPTEGVAKSETVYYLDQQDAINDINSEFKYARQQAKFNVVYDKNRANREDVEKILKNDEGAAVGVDIPEGYSIKDFIQSVVPPSLQYAELFDKSPQFEAIDRLSSVSGVMRGQQFKTNTTNGAIEKYSMNTQTRLDEKIDAVEDFIGDVGWKTLQLCSQFMDQETVGKYIGAKAAGWQNMSAEDFLSTYQYQVVGGSTQKPTSDAKKEQAMELGQVLGQFVNAAPVAVTTVMLKMFERSFSEINLTEEDWGSIQDAVTQQGQGQGDGNVTEMINKLPPEAKAALGKAIAQGVPVEQALEKIMEVAQQQQQQQPGGAGQPQQTIQ